VNFLGKIPLDPKMVQACEKGIPIEKTNSTGKALDLVSKSILRELNFNYE